MTTPLDVQGLTLSFGGLAVIKDVSLTLASGARTALIGPNGAGKTTLVNLICGLLRPDAGRVRLHSADVTSLSQTARVHRGLVRSFQVTRLFGDMTVLEHLIFALLARDRRMGGIWRDAAAMRGVSEEAQGFVARLKLGRIRDLRVGEIAYGQQRLVELAIALAMRPRVLLLDEPAAGIPRDGMDVLLAVLNDLPDDLAVMMIDHDMDLVRRFARHVVVLASGEVIADGAPDEVARDMRVRSAYLGT